MVIKGIQYIVNSSMLIETVQSEFKNIRTSENLDILGKCLSTATENNLALHIYKSIKNV